MDEILSEFIVESTEALDQLDVELVELERDPESIPTLSSIFRRIHTVKGTCGFLGFEKLERVTHVGEHLLSRLRDGHLSVTPEMTSELLALTDAVREMIDSIASTGSEGPGDYAGLEQHLRTLADHGTLGDPEGRTDPATEPAEPAPAADPPPATAPTDVDAAGGPEGPQAQPPSTAAVADSTIRVDVDVLDTLMNLVGELVLNRNQVLQFTKDTEDAALTATLQRLDLITTELQGSVMKTRMQPIENAWSKYPRIVRDLARQTGKDIDLETFGNETELDKTLLEAIKDPLTHIVRNAVDHGIEAPDVRTSRGKPPRGRLVLRAFHESGQVNIEISDDGAGIDPEKVKAKAVANGAVSAERAARMSRREATDLIFSAGLSTADTVSNISGRGVGMDVVRTNIEQIGGTVDVTSERGEGTTIRVKIPLTLAIIPALVVTSGDDHYAIPQVNLLELVRLNDPTGPGGIEDVHGSPVHRLRGELLPLVYLADVLGDERQTGAALSIVVLQAGERNFGLVVDDIEDTAEIVVKPLGRMLKHLSIFAGATIMGDGHVALILDVVGVAAEAGLLTDGSQHVATDGQDTAADQDQQALLLFELSGERPYALPLSQVARLEEFDLDRVERSGTAMVVQYRGEILPLVDVAGVLERSHGTQMDRSPLQVIVYARDDVAVGLVVGAITDIVAQDLDVRRDVHLPGLAGSAVISGRVTDIVDVDGLLSVSGLAALQ